jgi:hypothetical protein
MTGWWTNPAADRCNRHGDNGLNSNAIWRISVTESIERDAMKTIPLVWLGLVSGGCHFLASLLIVPLTLRIGEVLTAGAVKTTLMGTLHALTRILYYPILGLALYPRHWFPGPWITIPILANSLLWAVLFILIVAVWRRLRAASPSSGSRAG